MRRSMVVVSLLLAALLAKPGVVPAQQGARPTFGAWDSVQELSQGEEIEVVLNDQTPLRGKFAGASDAKMSLTRGGKTTELFRAEVFELYRLVSKSRKRSTLLGLGIGTGAGIGVGAIAGASVGPFESGEGHMPAMIGGMVGAGAGTLVGLFLGGGKKRVLIYRAVGS